MSRCLLCENTSRVSHVKKHGNYDILYCSECQLQFSNPMKVTDAAFYQECWLYEDLRSENVDMEMPSYDWRYRTLLELCPTGPRQSLLDIGCGTGGFMTLAQSRGFNVFGVDIDDTAVRLAKRVHNLEHVEHCSWEEVDGMEGWRDFDVITLFDVLEHLPSPVSVATAVFNLLKRGGLVCITVPRLDRCPPWFDMEIDGPPHHLTTWTAHALRMLLEGVGFVEIRVVEEPLLAEEFLVCLYFWEKRFIRRFRRDESNIYGERSFGTRGSSIRARNRAVERFVRRSIWIACGGIDWFLSISHLGRGTTLLAIGRKP